MVSLAAPHHRTRPYHHEANDHLSVVDGGSRTAKRNTKVVSQLLPVLVGVYGILP
jgi:hypothetical protein